MPRLTRQVLTALVQGNTPALKAVTKGTAQVTRECLAKLTCPPSFSRRTQMTMLGSDRIHQGIEEEVSTEMIYL